MLAYMTADEAAEKWNISHRRVITLCQENRIPDVAKVGNMWIIPKNAVKPIDLRKDKKKLIEQHFVVTIEETVSENFDVIARDYREAIDVAIKKYRNCEFVLEPGNLIFKQLIVYNTKNEALTEWIEF